MAEGFREKSAKYRAVIKNRRALRTRGLSRYEVRGLESDKALIKALAKKLALDDPAAKSLRSTLEREVTPPAKLKYANLWEWLRASPLVGSGINLEREVVQLRKIDL
jgi:hypothetical protein